MNLNKATFFSDLSKSISEPIYLTESTEQLRSEIESNHWIITIPNEIILEITTSDLVSFIEKVKTEYSKQLNESKLNINLIFYLWFEEPGQLHFNFINSNHNNLPFDCKLKFTSNAEEIIEEFLNSNYPDGVIPMNEFKTLETREEIEEADKLEKEMHTNFVLTVFQEVIRQN